MKYNNILTGFMMMFLLIGIVTASQQTLGKFKQFDSINLIQSCDNSTYSNISRIIYPNGSFALNTDAIMTKSGNNYNYSFIKTDILDRYVVYGHCDDNGKDTNWAYDFVITPSSIFGLDFSLNINIVLIIIFFVATGTLLFFREYVWGGFVLLITALIMIFSKVNIVLDLIIMALSVFIIFKGDVE